jgi:hypothetical protein
MVINKYDEICSIDFVLELPHTQRMTHFIPRKKMNHASAIAQLFF